MSNFIAGFGTATTSDNINYSVLMSPKRSSLIKGAVYVIEFPSKNTGAATLNVDGLGIKNIKTKKNNAVILGDILPQIYQLLFNGTDFIIDTIELPSMTQAQRQAISTPSVGLIIEQTDAAEGIWRYNGTDWIQL